MGGFLQGLGHVLKAGFEATPTGQRYQQVQGEKQQQALEQEQAERQFADYIQAKGGRLVHNGVVKRDHVMPDGTVLSDALLDKAGGEGRQIISHGQGKNKLQWELPSFDEQIGMNAGRGAHKFLAEAPTRQATAAELARNLGANKEAETAGAYRAQGAERQANGVTAEDVLGPGVVQGLGKNPDGSPKKVLIPELSSLLQARESAGNIESQIASRNTALEQSKLTNAMQDLSTVNDQGAYDQWRQKNPNVPAPETFTPAIKASMIRRNVPIKDQPEFDMKNLELQFANVDPQQINTEIDNAIDPKKYPTYNANLKAEVDQYKKAGQPKKAREAIVNTLGKISEHEAAVQKETDPRIVSSRVGQAIAVEKAKAALAPGGFSQIVDPATRNRAEIEYDKSAKAAGDTLAEARRMHALIAQAQNGNKAAPGLIPLSELRSFVNRVNAQELKAVGSGAGSVYDKVAGFLGGAIEGQPIPPSVLEGMDKIATMQEQLANQKHAQEVAVLNGKLGTQIKPVDFTATDPAKQAQHKAGDPVMYNGAMHKVLSVDPDGKLHLAP